MKAPLIIIMLCIGIFGTSVNSAIPIKNKYFAVRSYSLRNRLPRVDRSEELHASIQITEMRVHSEISLRYSTTTATTHVHNPGRWSQEYEFSMVLPETAFITGFTMIVDGKSYKAYVKEKEKAKEIYTEAVAKGIGAAHLATTVRDSNNFVVNVNVEGNSAAVFELRYEEFLVRRNGLYNHVINLYPGAFVPIMEVNVHIKESQKITKLLVPEIRTGNEIDASENDFQNSKAVIRKGKTDREVTVTFSPDLLDQKTLAEIYVNKTRRKSSLDKFIGYTSNEDEYDQDSKVIGQFVVQYDVSRPNNEEILVNDGYFVHFLAPASLSPLSKQVVFVLDTSYSMLGRKIVQLRNAMEIILSDLNPRDYFSIVEFNTHAKVHDLSEVHKLSSFDYRTYSTESGRWSKNVLPPTPATPQNIANAKMITSRLRASGGTNIDEALYLALNIVKFGVNLHNKTYSGSWNFDSDIKDTEYSDSMEQKGEELEPVIIFLTDGQPTYGVKNKDEIIANVIQQNSGHKRTSLYSLAFGEVPDRNFLRELSLKNEGFMRHIYEASDAALQLHNFYREISSPLLSHVQFLYPSRQVKEGSVSRNLFQTIHEGSEVAVVGEIVENVTEIASQVRGYRSTDDGTGRTSYELSSTVTVNSTKDEYYPLERLWAYLNIKQLMDKSITEDYGSDNENSSETKALGIALKYGFVTPLTSLVVVKPNEIKSVDVESVVTKSNIGLNISPMSIMPPIIKPRKFGIRKSYDERGSVKIDYRRDMNAVALFQSSKTLKVTSRRKSGHNTRSRTKSTKKTKSERKVIHRGSTVRNKSGKRKLKMESKSTRTGSRHKTKAVKSSAVPTTSYIESYSLEGFEWLSLILERGSDPLSVVFQANGIQVVLELIKTVDLLKIDAEDQECFNSIPIETEEAGENDMSGSVCVYITRCSAARNIPVDGYKKSYCFVNERYAGVCCPKSEVLE